jgi:hypothetical protein
MLSVRRSLMSRRKRFQLVRWLRTWGDVSEGRACVVRVIKTGERSDHRSEHDLATAEAGGYLLLHKNPRGLAVYLYQKASR